MKYKIGDRVVFRYGDSTFPGIINEIVNMFGNEIGYGIDSKEFPFGLYVSEVNICFRVKNSEEEKEVKTVPCDIVDYKVFNDKVVVVTFADGTEEKAVCDKRDNFDLERAVEVCVMKKQVGGHKAYNKLVRDAMKQLKAVDDHKKKEKAEEELKAKRRQKDIERKLKRKEKKRQEEIEIQKEAYLKAMQVLEASRKTE